MADEAITCRHCGKTSFNGKDVLNRYCGYCHVFHDDGLDWVGDSVVLKRLIEEVQSGEDTPAAGYNRIYHRHNR